MELESTIQIKEKVVQFIRKETVLLIAALLAVISIFITPVSREYISYMDFRTLGLLFCLMTVMAAFDFLGVFYALGKSLLTYAGSMRQVYAMLVFLCFFSSMFITNDVALITFVPFSIEVLQMVKRENKLIPVIVLQTIAANLGSMFTPIGNPQNLYLYNLSGMTLMQFMKLMAPFSVGAFAILVFALFLFPRDKSLPSDLLCYAEEDIESQAISRKSILIYLLLFFLCIATVAHMIPYQITMVTVILVTLLFQKEILKKVDYSLLLTFISFFIFIGNLGQTQMIKNFMRTMTDGNEILAGIGASQFISNVPAAILLSGFSTNYRQLIVGVNLGGLGTLIASMASLISYKYYVQSYQEKKGKYLAVFTLTNVICLFILLFLDKIFLK